MEESIRCYAAAAEQGEGEGEGVDQAQTPACGLQVCKPGWYPREEEEATEESTEEAGSGAGGKGARGKNKPRGAIRAEMRQKKRDIVRGELDAKLKGNLALYECVAHIECSVESRDEAEGQVLLYATIERWAVPSPSHFLCAYSLSHSFRFRSLFLSFCSAALPQPGCGCSPSIGRGRRSSTREKTCRPTWPTSA